MSLLIQYDFSSSSFRAPDTIKNIASGNTSYLYNATMVNNPQINSIGVTKQSSSVLFNVSKQQYIKIPALSIGNTGLTFTFWFKSNNNDTWARIFDFGNGPGNNNIIAFINNGYLGFAVYLGGNVGYHPSNVIPNVNNNTWTHIAWTLTYPNGWNIYLNGTLYTTFSDGSYPNSVFKNLNYIGKSNWNDPYFNGNIADFRIYNSVLSVNDVSSIYKNDKTLLSKTTGDVILNTGYNELYNQIFCDLFKTNNGFNQCQNCNYGQKQEVFSTTTEVGEQNCLTACQNEPHCTSYSYDTTSSSNNCIQYNTFPNEILNGVNGTNSGYSLGKYSYDYSNLSNSQKSNVQEKCIAQYLNNYFTPKNQIDVSKCLTNTTSENNTNINADAKCIYNIYLTNGLNPPTVNKNKYNENPDYNLTHKDDEKIHNYKTNYNNYSNELVELSNINNKLSNNLSQNDINYNSSVYNANANLYNKYEDSIKKKKKEMNNALDSINEQFENEIINNNNIRIFGLLIIVLLILLIYLFKK
jgi:hypothetical protein